MQLIEIFKRKLWEVFQPLFSAISHLRQKPVDHYFAKHDIAQFFQWHLQEDRVAIDDQTWRDLLLDDYFDLLKKESSIFAQQALYRRLRLGLALPQHAAQREKLQFYLTHPERCEQLEQICLHLRRVDTEVASLLFNKAPLPQRPAWFGVAGFLPLLLILSLVGVISALLVPAASALSKLAFFSCLPISLVLFAIQLHYRETVRTWNYSMYSIKQMLGTCSRLGQIEDPQLAEFSQYRAATSKITAKLTRLPSPFPFMEGTSDYFDWFLLGNLKHYFADAQVVAENLALIQAAFIRCAEFEADLVIARHLRQTSPYCWAELAEQTRLSVTNIVHPLLKTAMPLSLNTDALADEDSDQDSRKTSVFLSGQNGIGKSTLLRTLGLNLIAARAFGFCYASAARLPCCPIFASMQNEDSLLDGESLYISELRRAQELMQTIDRVHETKHAVFIIDEIFRGTNYLESISAASAVLHRLSLHGTVLVSSHHLVLVRLLHARFQAFCLELHGDPGSDGGLRLLPGLLSKTNGITLLRTSGFDAGVEEDANKVMNWLNAYLSHPEADVDIYQ